MIKINLLGGPRRKKRTKKGFEVQSQLVLGSAVISVGIIVLGYAWILLNEKIGFLQNQKAALTQELNALKKQVQEVENFEKDKKNFEEKIKIIQKLRQNQSGPVRLLDQISRGLPERIWLLRLSESKGTVELEGRAITNSEIVDFINSLKGAPSFSDVQLIESRQSTVNNIPIYNFRLKWTLVS